MARGSIDRLKELTAPTGEEDLMAVDYPTPRWSVSMRQALIIAGVVVVVLLAWVGWNLTRQSAPADDPLAIPASAAADHAVSTSSEPSGELVVAVVGAVHRPGLVSVPEGSRVADALDAATPLPEADLAAINIARLLVDGEQIVVPLPGEAPAPAPEAGGGGVLDQADGKVRLNSAAASELVTLPGVGEATASAIISHRDTHGPFADIDALIEVRGIGPAKLESLRDLVSL